MHTLEDARELSEKVAAIVQRGGFPEAVGSVFLHDAETGRVSGIGIRIGDDYTGCRLSSVAEKPETIANFLLAILHERSQDAPLIQ